MSTAESNPLSSFDALPDTAGVSKKIYCLIATRSPASADRDIAAGIVDSVMVGGSRRILVGSIRKLFKK